MREHLLTIMNAALESVATAAAVQRNLPQKPKGKCVIIGAGKASAEMAAAVEEVWGDVDISGIVTTRYGHAVPTKKVRVIEAGHPIPDENSVAGATEVISILQELSEDDLVLALISGGGSATLELPIENVSLEDIQSLTRQLLGSGASISQINIVRQALSQVKGGKLAKHCTPARLVSLIISDVPGDDLSLVASGPTVAPTPSQKSPSKTLETFGLNVPNGLETWTEFQNTTPNAEAVLIANNHMALKAAGNCAEKLGYTPKILGDNLQGDSAQLGADMAQLVTEHRSAEASSTQSWALISGGETTVMFSNGVPEGIGGPNHEFLLSFAANMEQSDNVWGLAIDTDGFDGSADAAGAICTPDTSSRAVSLGLDARKYLSEHNSHTFFEALGDVVRTGATQTNVNDLRIILIGIPAP